MASEVQPAICSPIRISQSSIHTAWAPGHRAAQPTALANPPLPIERFLDAATRANNYWIPRSDFARRSPSGGAIRGGRAPSAAATVEPRPPCGVGEIAASRLEDLSRHKLPCLTPIQHFVGNETPNFFRGIRGHHTDA